MRGVPSGGGLAAFPRPLPGSPAAASRLSRRAPGSGRSPPSWCRRAGGPGLRPSGASAEREQHGRARRRPLPHPLSARPAMRAGPTTTTTPRPASAQPASRRDSAPRLRRAPSAHAQRPPGSPSSVAAAASHLALRPPDLHIQRQRQERRRGRRIRARACRHSGPPTPVRSALLINYSTR